MKMKAIVKKEAKVGLWLEDCEKPELEPRHVMIKVIKTAICGTDLHIYNWDSWAQKTINTPLIIGHEFMGEIVEIGPGVENFEKGMIVGGEGHLVCGVCRNCLAGRRHLCSHTKGVGVNVNGAFAEYVSIPVTNVWVHDPKIDQNIMACFDPLGNAAHTALSFDVLGEDVLVTGAGPIGIMAALIAKHAGARHVIITDINPSRLELAKKSGVEHCVNTKDEKLEVIMKRLDMKEGFDVGMEMSGSPIALNEMISTMSHGGKIAMLGIQPDDTTIDWNTVIFNGLVIKGIYGREMYETWYKMTSMIQSGLDITPLITHELHYTQFQEGIDAMQDGTAGKVVLNWD
jgi:threonine 3-dehydrogenase